MENYSYSTKVSSAGAVTAVIAPHIPGASSFAAQVTVARPGNTTNYTAGDVMGATAAAIEFPNMGVSGGHLMITDADLRVDLSSVPAGMTSFRLHLYDATPPSALADNAVWDLPSGDRASYLGYVDLGTVVDVGSTLFVQSGGLNRKVAKLSTTSLFGYLVTNGAYTPAALTVHAVRLHAVGM